MNSMTVNGKMSTQKALDVNTLNESVYMGRAIVPFLEEQVGTLTQTYANDVRSMYARFLKTTSLSNDAGLMNVLGLIIKAHLRFADVVDPELFETSLNTTVENEFMISRRGLNGGRAILLIEEDLITLSFLPEIRNKTQEVLSFHYPEEMEPNDYWKLMCQFFEF